MRFQSEEWPESNQWRRSIEISWLTSMLVPSSDTCCDGANSTMWSVTDRSQSISLFHRALRSADMGSRRRCSPNMEAADFPIMKEIYASGRTLKKHHFFN